MNRRHWSGSFSSAVGGPGWFALREERGGVQLLLIGAEVLDEVAGVAAGDGTATGGRRRAAEPRNAIVGEGADLHAGRQLGQITQVEVRWHDGGATVRLDGEGGARELSAAQVIVHEPLAHLYDDLHLPELSPPTRRFWQRLFLLARLPGGAPLIRFIARRTRAKA